MRGKVSVLDGIKSTIGITPAYAGKSKREPYSFRFSWDHPRLCGEKANIPLGHGAASGSPPPMRGKAYYFRAGDRVKRITPAYAGKSLTTISLYSSTGDHPRLCGEKLTFYRRTQLVVGSPPPMRGKGQIRATSASQQRITPAYAGKSNTIRNKSRRGYGSPPPMRGKDIPKLLKTKCCRITPAYAGKRLKRS